jgi:choline-sulfatase
MEPITRRATLGAFIGASAAQVRSSRRKPNFLFLISDDHAAYVMGCDGNRLAQTPNLDRLASQGMLFARHYCNAPVCTPSRQSFFTGLLPHAAGVTRLPTSLSPDKPNLAKQFHAAGYQTAVFNKMHFNRAPEPGMYGFDVAMIEQAIQKAWLAEVKPKPVPPGIRTKPVWRPFKDPARIWLNSEKLPMARSDAEMKSTFVVRKVDEYLAQNKDKPFALWVSFQEPHSPFDFPIEDRDRFDPKRFPVEKVGPEDAWQIPLIFRDLTDDEKRGITAAYYTSTYFLDRNIGRVLDLLKKYNLEEDTFVVYLGDNGYCLGHHGRFEKHTGYEPALRVPLILRFPGRIRQGVVKDLTSNVDLTATILDMMDVPPIPNAHGRSLRAYLEGRKPALPREYIFSEYLENEEAYLRTPKWKFIFCSGRRRREDGYETDNPTPGRYVRLFDLEKDPGEFQNVAPKHPDVVAKLETIMLDQFRTTHPDAEKEPPRLSREEAIEFYLRPRDV